MEENLASKAAIDWFNGRARAFDADGREVKAAWTTGATAMIGTSYDGTLPIGAASLGVDGLRAIVPIAGVSSYYDHRRSYGTVINSYPGMGTDADTLFDNVLSRKHPDVCAYMREHIARAKDRATGDYNAFWNERTPAARLHLRGGLAGRPDGTVERQVVYDAAVSGHAPHAADRAERARAAGGRRNRGIVQGVGE